MSNRELMEQRRIDNARRWEQAKRSVKRQVQVLLVIGAILAGGLWYLYFEVSNRTITLTPAEQQAIKERGQRNNDREMAPRPPQSLPEDRQQVMGQLPNSV